MNVKNIFTSHIDKKVSLTFLFLTTYLYAFSLYENPSCIYFDKILVSEYKLLKRSNKANRFIALVQYSVSQIKMTFQEIRIIATGPCITNQLRNVSTICSRSWYIAAHIWKIYDFKIEVIPLLFTLYIIYNSELKIIVCFI